MNHFLGRHPLSAVLPPLRVPIFAGNSRRARLGSTERLIAVEVVAAFQAECLEVRDGHPDIRASARPFFLLGISTRL